MSYSYQWLSHSYQWVSYSHQWLSHSYQWVSYSYQWASYSYQWVSRSSPGSVPLIIDGGQCRYGQNGTMVDFTMDIVTVLSYGPISSDNLKQLLPEVELPSHLRK